MHRWMSYACVTALFCLVGCLQEVPPPEEDMGQEPSASDDMDELDDTGQHRAGADAEQGDNDMSHMVGRKEMGGGGGGGDGD